jgi:ribosomal protein L11 methyltransferase
VPEPRYCYVHVKVAARDAELVSSDLWDRGAGGIEERSGNGRLTLVAYFPSERRARRAVAAYGRRAHVAYVIGDDWLDAWKQHFRPVRIGQRLVVEPSWDRATPWPGEVVLTLDPGRAFGTGAHETTRLVLRELDRRVRGGERVLDVGCGSGILSIASILLGARTARAIDTDETVLAVVRENAAQNRVAHRVRASATPIERVRGEYDLVVANIEAGVLIPMARVLAKRLARGGVLVLSGLLRGQETEIGEAFAPLRTLLCAVDGEWVALTMAHPRSGSRS